MTVFLKATPELPGDWFSESEILHSAHQPYCEGQWLGGSRQEHQVRRNSPPSNVSPSTLEAEEPSLSFVRLSKSDPHPGMRPWDNIWESRHFGKFKVLHKQTSGSASNLHPQPRLWGMVSGVAEPACWKGFTLETATHTSKLRRKRWQQPRPFSGNLTSTNDPNNGDGKRDLDA